MLIQVVLVLTYFAISAYFALATVLLFASGVHFLFAVLMERLQSKLGEVRFQRLRLRLAFWVSVLLAAGMSLLSGLYMFVALTFWAAKGKIMLEFWPGLCIAAVILIALCISLGRKRELRLFGDQTDRALLPRVLGVWLLALWAMDLDFSWWTDYVLYPVLRSDLRALIWNPYHRDGYVAFDWDVTNISFVAIVLVFLVLSCRYVVRNSFEYFRLGRGNVITVFKAKRRMGFLFILGWLSLDPEKIAYRSAIPEESPAFHLSSVMALLTPIENLVYQFVGLMVLLILLKECGQIAASIRASIEAVQANQGIADHEIGTVSAVVESA